MPPIRTLALPLLPALACGGFPGLRSQDVMQFGKYQIVEQIGEGGFGRIYKGYDPALKRTVAVKTCTLRGAELRARFVREAEIAANLRHPNIVTVYDFGEQDGEPYLVQEYLPGEDLDAAIKREQPIPIETKIGYLLQAARGLAHAHAHGVVHRDVKPANVRVQPDGVIRIMDFGIAKLLEADEQLTQVGMSLGTVGYLAPEQLRGQPIDHRADIFAFGALAYELVTYQKAFPGEDVSTIFYRIAHEEPQPIPALRSDCPPSLVSCIERCLRKQPDERYGSLAGAIADLETALDEVRRGLAAGPAAAGVAGRGTGGNAAGGAAAGASPRRGVGPRTWGLITATIAVALFGIVNVARWAGSAPADAGHAGPAPVGNDGALGDSTGVAQDPPAAGQAAASASDRPPVVADPPGERTARAAQRDAAGRSSGTGAATAATRDERGRAANTRDETAAPAAAAALPAHRVLVLLYGAEGAAEAAESALLRELLQRGAEVMDGASVDAETAARGAAASIAALGRRLGAGTVLVAQLAADAQPSVGAFFTGTATLSLKTYDSASGRLLGTETFQVGSGQTPGKLGPTALAAAAEAAAEVGRRAGSAAARQIESRR